MKQKAGSEKASDTLSTETHGFLTSETLSTETHGFLTSGTLLTETHGFLTSETLSTETHGFLTSETLSTETHGFLISDTLSTKTHGFLASGSCTDMWRAVLQTPPPRPPTCQWSSTEDNQGKGLSTPQTLQRCSSRVIRTIWMTEKQSGKCWAGRGEK